MLDRWFPDGTKRYWLGSPLFARTEVPQTRPRRVRILSAPQGSCPVALDLAHTRFIRFISQGVMMRKFRRHRHLIPLISKITGVAFADIESQSDIRRFPLTSPDAMMQWATKVARHSPGAGGAPITPQPIPSSLSTEPVCCDRLAKIARSRAPAAAKALLRAFHYPNGGVGARWPRLHVSPCQNEKIQPSIDSP